MKPIEKVVKSFSNSEFDAFVTLLSVRSGRPGVLDKELVQAMRQEGFDSDAFIAKAYKKDAEKGKSRFHALRRRVASQLVDFLAYLESEDASPEAEIERKIRASKYLRRADCKDWSDELLAKASNEAADIGDIFTKAWVLNEEIRALGTAINPGVDEILTKREPMSKAIDEEQRILLAEHDFRKALSERRAKGDASDALPLMKSISEKHHVGKNELKDVVTLHRMTTLFRLVLLVDKAFPELRSFLRDQYERIQELGGYSKGQHHLEMEMKYARAHAAYRCRDFDEALSLIKEMRQKSNHSLSIKGHNWLTKALLLEAQTMNFSGDLDGAIGLLDGLMESDLFVSEEPDSLNLKLNLSVLYFQKGRFELTEDILRSFNRRDGFYQNRMGREWLLKKQMIDLITCIELHEDHRAKGLIVRIKQGMGDFFRQKRYRRVEVFLQQIEHYMNHRDEWEGEDRLKDLQDKLEEQDKEMEDLQAVAFYTWLKSKAMRVNYYALLLEMLRSKE